MVYLLDILGVIANQIPQDLFLMFEIGIMIIIAGILGFLFRLAKQPLIPAYIIAGIILGPLSVGLIQNVEVLRVLSEIGIAFLVFYAGTEIDIGKLREVGKAATLGGIFQILLLFGAGFLVSTWLGFAGRAPIYIGLVVAFSSTMVVLKLLADKKELSSLHGRIIIGILLVQDIAAIIALTVLTTDFTLASIGLALAKAAIFVIVALILTKAINPIFRIAAKSTELLLLMAITLLFIFALGSYVAELSLVIGAFFAGLVLANSYYKTEIQGKILPIRDFFAVLFFVALGMQLTLISMKFVILLISLLVLVMLFKPIIIMFLIRIFGYTKRTSFFSGNSLAQTSEFSLIIATIGLTLGYIDSGLFSTLVLLTVITMAATTYLIDYDRFLFDHLSWPLNILNKVRSRSEETPNFIIPKKKIVIFGCHRMGRLFLKAFREEKKGLLVIDYNPDIIRSLIRKRIPCIYGDISNTEVLEKADIWSSEAVVSTIPDIEDNLTLLERIKEKNKEIIVIVTANSLEEGEKLYKAGADYVILPKVIGGEVGAKLVKKLLRNKKEIKDIRKEQISYIKSMHRILSERS